MAMDVRTTVRTRWEDDGRQSAAASDTTIASAERRALDYREPDMMFPRSGPGNNTYDWLSSQLAVEDTDRKKLLNVYREIDEEMTEVSSALDIYADNVTQVDMSKDSTSRGQENIVTIISSSEAVRDLLVGARERLGLNSRAWGVARDLVKYGEVFEEVVVRDDLVIDRLKTLPPEMMERNEDRYGVLNPKAAFLQMSPLNRPLAVFEDWEVLHYRLQRGNEDRYGTSILKPIRRVYKQLRMMEDAMVLARLTRANSRLVYKVDVGTLAPAMAREHLEKVKNDHRKRRLIDPRTGTLREDANPMAQEEDIFIATGAASKGGVEQLYGDLNISNLGDVEYFQNKLYGSLKVPKSFAGLERDSSSKATLTLQDIQFARSVRRVQTAMRLQYHALFELVLLLEGGNLSSADMKSTFNVAMPGMQTVDELREWEMMRIQAEVARIWVQELYLEPRAVYEVLLGFTKEQSRALFQGSASEFAKMEKNVNAAKSFKADQDNKFNVKAKEALGDDLDILRELAEMKLDDLRLRQKADEGYAG